MHDHADELVRITNMTFKRNDRLIFDEIGLVIPRGKITAIMGPSGSGKTTLLKLIGGQLKPESGKIEVFGQNINKIKQRALYKARQQMGLLFQANALFTNLSVFENVAFPLREHTTLPEALIQDLVLMKLEAVGLRGTAEMLPAELSGGMARRVALARTIALDPALLMYDEPFTGQDPISMGVLVKLVKELNQALGMTSVIVSHDVPETMSISDYVYLLSEGKVIGQGTPEELHQNDDPRVKQFIQGLPDGAVPFHYPAADFEQVILEGAHG